MVQVSKIAAITVVLLLLVVGIYVVHNTQQGYELGDDIVASMASSSSSSELTGGGKREQVFDLCTSKRIMVKNVLNEDQCGTIVKIARNALAEASVGDKLAGAALSDVLATTKNTSDFEVLLHARRQMRDIITKSFNFTQQLCYEFTHITRRSKSLSDYSHGSHADNCQYDVVTNTCTERPESCCSWRHVSALLYLNSPPDFEGGSFYFQDRDNACFPTSLQPGEDITHNKAINYDPTRNKIQIQTSCGTMVAFTSGKENVHGVDAVKKGERWALAIWFTFNCATQGIEKVSYENGNYRFDRKYLQPGELDNI